MATRAQSLRVHAHIGTQDVRIVVAIVALVAITCVTATSLPRPNFNLGTHFPRDLTLSSSSAASSRVHNMHTTRSNNGRLFRVFCAASPGHVHSHTHFCACDRNVCFSCCLYKLLDRRPNQRCRSAWLQERDVVAAVSVHVYLPSGAANPRPLRPFWARLVMHAHRALRHVCTVHRMLVADFALQCQKCELKCEFFLRAFCSRYFCAGPRGYAPDLIF